MPLLSDHAMSPYAQKIPILLREKGLTFERRLEWMIRSGGLHVVLDGLAADDIRFTDTARFAATAYAS
jgi:hypothetical protein